MGWVFNIDQSVETTFITLQLSLIHQYNINVFHVDAAELFIDVH